jgi:gamma-glutamyltranspeptidase/glutathione hydrolase
MTLAGHRRIRITLSLVTAVTLSVSQQAAAVSPQPEKAQSGMVVTSHHLASEIGAAILKQGGNAVDAAVAVGYALAVVLPCCGNIGGGGFATLRLADGTETFFNFREKAPRAATAKMYLDALGEVIPKFSLEGYKSVAVPGTVLGMETMLQKYGTMTRERVMAPAIALAEQGFILTEADTEILSRATEQFISQPNIAAIFLHDGKPWLPGERLIQENLAKTLKLISANGPDAFYKGAIANAIVAASSLNGGILSKKDFEDYTVVETAPIRCSYRGYEFISAPPPSSGGTTVCLILNILESYPMSDFGFHSAKSISLMVEAMRHAYVDRNFLLGDPAFVNNPLERLLSKEYAAKIRATIGRDKAANSSEVRPGFAPHEGTETTHYSVVDKNGSAVSVTYTINANFGAMVIPGNTGFFLNDEMDDFTIKPGVANLFGLVQGQTNAIAPGKRPLSSMSPAIVAKDGKTLMVIGSPGGARIITITLQALMNVIDYGMNIQEAIDSPRIHHQWMPDKIFVEPRALSPDTLKILNDMGYKIEEQAPWGAAAAILMPAPPSDAATAAHTLEIKQPVRLQGANDNRRPAGAAVGY